jgi:chemotaxis protein CheX
MSTALETLSDTVVELCGTVWSQVLELPLQHVPDQADLVSGASIQGIVRITGTWTGGIVLQCSSAFAYAAARRVFAGNESALSAEDARDTVGELTNIIGGNLKGILSDGSCRLSLPTVIDAQRISLSEPGARIVSREAFMCSDGPVLVTVFETAR